MALSAVDALDGADAQLLADHLRGCPDCGADAEVYREAATALALSLEPVAPPAAVRGAILRAVGGQADERNADLEGDLPDNVRVGAFDSRWWAVAACLFLALWGWREISVRSLRERVKTEEAETRATQEQNRLLQDRNERMTAQMQMLAAPDTRTIALAGQAVAPSASARVFMEPSKRRATVFFYNLPKNPGDKSYQLWILRADQPQPQSAGTFDVGAEGQSSLVVGNLPLETEIKGLAVTMESRGGVAAPTSTTFYVASQG